MKTILRYAGVILLALTMAQHTVSAQTAPAAPLPALTQADQLLPATVGINLTIRNVQYPDKPIYVGIYKKTDVFPLAGFQSYTHQFTPGKTGAVTVSISGLEPGTYAIALFQDMNGSGNMETNSVGYPKEPCGVLNQKPHDYSEPTFEQSKIELLAETTEAAIDLIYRFPFMQKVTRFFTSALIGL